MEKLVNIDNAPSTSAASHVTADPVPSIPAENAADSRDWRPNYYGDMNDEEIDFGLDEIDGPRSVSNPLQRQTCANVNDLVLSNLYSNAAACNCTPAIVNTINQNICSHSLEYSECAKCKGKHNERSLKPPLLDT